MGWPGPLTHRQFKVWQEWFLQNDNTPSRSDHYQMQTTMAIASLPNTFWGQSSHMRLDQFKIKFKRKVSHTVTPLTEITAEERALKFSDEAEKSFIASMQFTNAKRAPAADPRPIDPDEIPEPIHGRG